MALQVESSYNDKQQKDFRQIVNNFPADFLSLKATYF